MGCQAAAWWLRREAGRFTALKAVGVGLASTLAAYVAGPVLWAGAGLAGSSLALAALSDAARVAFAASRTIRTSALSAACPGSQRRTEPPAMP